MCEGESVRAQKTHLQGEGLELQPRERLLHLQGLRVFSQWLRIYFRRLGELSEELT